MLRVSRFVDQRGCLSGARVRFLPSSEPSSWQLALPVRIKASVLVAGRETSGVVRNLASAPTCLRDDSLGEFWFETRPWRGQLYNYTMTAPANSDGERHCAATRSYLGSLIAQGSSTRLHNISTVSQGKETWGPAPSWFKLLWLLPCRLPVP